ncbi:hypothetical protein M422DRAFT_34312 [Sphaerobolus stellatus SS14]|uniref:Uncharacterized protein n=1 Tax=Sphaerobolus stellatus (strain SS14) TaxID=990650 RepID=A0A0C9VG48_SPHS4|nr:hypothetical protein M422DRAFT_34312 [Sphaerobolus stellatus SS14]
MAVSHLIFLLNIAVSLSSCFSLVVTILYYLLAPGRHIHTRPRLNPAPSQSLPKLDICWIISGLL